MKIGIAGAGIMGRLMAFELINAGYEVTIFDKSEVSTASMAAAGMLTPMAELDKSDLLIYEMGMSSIQHHWPKILNSLPESIYYKTLGSLLVSHAGDKQELKRYAEILIAKIPENTFLKSLNRDDILQIEPDLNQFHHGYYLSCEAQIDNQHLMTVLEKNLLDFKVEWYKNQIVNHVSPYHIETSDQTFNFDLVIDCRGLGAKQLFKELRSVRGELVWLYAPDVRITRPVRFLHPRYSLYIVPRPSNVYIIGASEIEVEDYSSISVQTLLELLSACYSVSSRFKQARLLKTVTQCRPVLPHHYPEVKYRNGLIAINGLYRHGYLVAPALAHDVLQKIHGGELNYPSIWKKVA